MVNRNRGILLKFYVSEKELEQIRMKMEQYSSIQIGRAHV